MRRVLILEQEAFLGALLSERFERSGFEVELLPHTPPAPLADVCAPDLIIVGAHEPGALQRLHSWVAATPVIVLGEQPNTLPSWLFPTLGKPFSPNQLIDLANRYLVARKLHQSIARTLKVGTIPIS